MIDRSEKIIAIVGSLHKVQGELRGVAKDSKNPHFKNTYASLEAVIDAAKPALQANGITFLQAPGAINEKGLEVTTTLFHTSGEWLSSTLTVPLQKKDAQGVGSAITYACRYSLMAMLGLPPVDDDGEAAKKPEKADDAAPKPFTASESVLRGSYWVRKINEAKDLLNLKAINASDAFKADWQRLQDKDAEAITTAYGDRKAALESA